jgi:hypothetical protein
VPRAQGLGLDGNLIWKYDAGSWVYRVAATKCEREETPCVFAYLPNRMLHGVNASGHPVWLLQLPQWPSDMEVVRARRDGGEVLMVTLSDGHLLVFGLDGEVLEAALPRPRGKVFLTPSQGPQHGAIWFVTDDHIRCFTSCEDFLVVPKHHRDSYSINSTSERDATRRLIEEGGVNSLRSALAIVAQIPKLSEADSATAITQFTNVSGLGAPFARWEIARLLPRFGALPTRYALAWLDQQVGLGPEWVQRQLELAWYSLYQKRSRECISVLADMMAQGKGQALATRMRVENEGNLTAAMSGKSHTGLDYIHPSVAYALALNSKTRGTRGKLLEDAIASALASILGFSVRTRLRTRTEEIDIVIRNEASGFWAQYGPWILGECKNWSKRVGKAELAAFRDKMLVRPRCSLGLFFAPAGVTADFETHLLRYSSQGTLVVVLQGNSLREFFRSENRSSVLVESIERTFLQ